MPIQPRAATLRVNSALNSVCPRCRVNAPAAISACRNSRTSCCSLRAETGNSSEEKSTWSNMRSAGNGSWSQIDLRTERLDQPVDELVSVVQRFHADALVQTMDSAAIEVAKHSRNAIGRDADIVEKAAIRRRDEHCGDDRNARPHLRADRFHRFHD